MKTISTMCDVVIELLKAGVCEVKAVGDDAVAMRPRSAINMAVRGVVKDNKCWLLNQLKDPEWWMDVKHTWDERLSICLADGDVKEEQAHKLATADVKALLNQSIQQASPVEIIKSVFAGQITLMPDPHHLDRLMYGGQPEKLRPALYEYWKRWRNGDGRDTDPLHGIIENGSGEAYAWRRIKLLPPDWKCPYSDHPDEAHGWLKRHIEDKQLWRQKTSGDTGDGANHPIGESETDPLAPPLSQNEENQLWPT